MDFILNYSFTLYKYFKNDCTRKTQRIQINLDLSPELYETLNHLAQQMNGENAEVLLKAMPTLTTPMH
jgi:hypothetical protein